MAPDLLERHPPLLCLVGPTGAGKSDMALDVAERAGAEILVADSRQVYRGLDIGTAKPSPADRARVPHHLLDLVEPDQPYNAGRYGRDAAACVDALAARGVRSLVVAGTGLYLRALLWGLCDGPPADDAFRSEWRRREQAQGPAVLYRRLVEVDPRSAAAIHPHDRPKILRALEVHALTGVPLSALQAQHGFATPRYRAITVGLRRRRDDLYRRIDARVDAMIAEGWIDEVRRLRARGLGPDLPALRAVGYRQLWSALSGETAMDEAIRVIKRDTRRYAKRQLTWFGRAPNVHWIDWDPAARREDVVDRVMACLADAAPALGSGSTR